ncbi:tlde1 domain-containing protein (plasmid) [Mesorhizobium atlanticum]|uniref:tlde1 domain-containing protein n=1 Tax=Mesorhizobium atlanticum TaxID=2233532 RepID=UPI003704657F
MKPIPGLGAYFDNPTFVSKKDVGPTPPNTYKLSMRESRFHGVEAIRLTPTTGQSMYGRDGFLAHTYMLRGRYAQSNGCVSFKKLRAIPAGLQRRESHPSGCCARAKEGQNPHRIEWERGLNISLALAAWCGSPSPPRSRQEAAIHRKPLRANPAGGAASAGRSD